jgi:hypothetical protein
MRGPYERLKYDFRRHWECPACKRHDHTPGSVVFRFCTCQPQQATPMRLVQEGGARLWPAPISQRAAEPVPERPAGGTAPMPE